MTVASANPDDFGIFFLYVTGYLIPYIADSVTIRLYIGKTTAENRFAPQFVEKIKMYHTVEYL